jgi:hypothetical protein
MPAVFAGGPRSRRRVPRNAPATRQLLAAYQGTLLKAVRRTTVLARADALLFPDVDSMLRRVYGSKSQNAGFGDTKGRRFRRVARLQPPDRHTVQSRRDGRKRSRRPRYGQATSYRREWTLRAELRSLPTV